MEVQEAGVSYKGARARAYQCVTMSASLDARTVGGPMRHPRLDYRHNPTMRMVQLGFHGLANGSVGVLDRIRRTAGNASADDDASFVHVVDAAELMAEVMTQNVEFAGRTAIAAASTGQGRFAIAAWVTVRYTGPLLAAVFAPVVAPSVGAYTAGLVTSTLVSLVLLPAAQVLLGPYAPWTLFSGLGGLM